MNNLHRELAPISAVAWADLEEEARRSFKRHVAGRRVVDVPQPDGLELSATTTGHLDEVAAPADGVIAHMRRSQPIVELRVPSWSTASRSTTSSAAPRTRTGSRSRTPPGGSRSP